MLANSGFGCSGDGGWIWVIPGQGQQPVKLPDSLGTTTLVSDPPAEAIYLRDEESGEVWSPTPLPAGAGSAVCVRHGQGYTSYTCHSHGVKQELLVLVPTDDPVANW